jgi:cyclopropane-fatty-acyl-phospholipid synthase
MVHDHTLDDADYDSATSFAPAAPIKDLETMTTITKLDPTKLDTQLADLPFMARRIMRLVMQSEFGSIDATVPTGQRYLIQGSKPGPNAEIKLRNWGILTRTLRYNSIGTGESYIDGDWDSPDPAKVLEFALINWETTPLYEQGLLSTLVSRFRHFTNRNTKRGSKRNISAHYDLGNDFYALWLDETMTYSSAIFRNGTQDLAAAQNEKYRHLAEKTGITPDHSVLEIGCGWGGFAEFAAREIGCKVKCLTISREQLDYAQKRIFEAGLNDKIDFAFQDYRDETGQYDSVISIEMIEAVGETFWPSYYSTVANSLRSGGKAGIQAIAMNDVDFPDYRASPDFIQRYVFPGGMLMSPDTLERLGHEHGLEIADTTVFPQDYADTLAIWRERFLQNWPKIKPMGFDDKFKRLWEFYLFYCEAGFRHETLDVRQVIYQKP